MSDSLKNIAWDQRLARILVRPLVRTSVHPNAITTLGLMMGLLAGYLFAQGDPVLANWAAGIFMFAAFVDHVDGELARLVDKTSTFGHYYDHVAVGVSYVSLFVGMGIGQRYGPLGDWGMFLGAATGVAVAAIMSVRVEIEVREGLEAVKQGSIAGFELEDILYMVGPVIWLGYGLPFLVVAGIGAPLFLVLTAWERMRNSRGRDSRGRGQS